MCTVQQFCFKLQAYVINYVIILNLRSLIDIYSLYYIAFMSDNGLKRI